MNIALIAIDTKFIHTNMALRYLKANCGFESTLFEFTIKDAPERIVDTLRAFSPDVAAFSCYLWNISLVEKIAAELKKIRPVTMVIGGPEVSYDAETYLKKPDFDFLIAGEGEIAFDRLMKHLDGQIPVESVPNLIRRGPKGLLRNPIEPILNLDALKSPYRFPEDLPHLPQKIQYVELSRGCPYHCSYCLAALDNRVRFFSLDRVKSELSYLMEHGAKTFKFLDRTFNLKPALAEDIFGFLIDNHRDGTVFQFEITGDILPLEIVDFINANAPKGLFRFEIGIQTTNVESNLAVDRKQDNVQLFEVIRRIQNAGIIDLHLDLIAGLPGEDLQSFQNTFDEVFALRPKELQLGFLKMLRGTKIRREADRYGYVYQKNPPYEILENQMLSSKDMETIHLAEEALDLYWNKAFLPDTMTLLMNKVPSPFELFEELGRFFIANSHSFHRYEYSDVFEWLADFLAARFPESYPILLDSLKREYLLSSKMKPKIWWNAEAEKAEKNAVLRDLFAVEKSISLDDLYKHAVITRYGGKHLIVVYGTTPPRHFIH